MLAIKPSDPENPNAIYILKSSLFTSKEYELSFSMLPHFIGNVSVIVSDEITKTESQIGKISRSTTEEK